MNAEWWSVLGTILATLVFAIVPGVLYAYYLLERWIDDKASYERVMLDVAKTRG
jgi:phosphate/sulfate permease